MNTSMTEQEKLKGTAPTRPKTQILTVLSVLASAL